MFFQIHHAPVLIDEVQYAPELFPYIKIQVDKTHTPGEFWLTGSQIYKLMRGVKESLAGRAALLNLFSLSQSEVEERNEPQCGCGCNKNCFSTSFSEPGSLIHNSRKWTDVFALIRVSDSPPPALILFVKKVFINERGADSKSGTTQSFIQSASVCRLVPCSHCPLPVPY
jgi:hypothetical protein